MIRVTVPSLQKLGMLPRWLIKSFASGARADGGAMGPRLSRQVRQTRSEDHAPQVTQTLSFQLERALAHRSHVTFTLVIRLHRCLHTWCYSGARGRHDRFSTVDKRFRCCKSGSASHGAAAQTVCLPRVSGHTEACAHVGAVGRRSLPTDFRLSRNGGGSVPVAVHSLRECRRAME